MRPRLREIAQIYVSSISLIIAPFEDFPGSIATRAVDYAKIFENKGFDSKASLKLRTLNARYSPLYLHSTIPIEGKTIPLASL